MRNKQNNYKDFHGLLGVFAKSRAEASARSRAAGTEEEEHGKVMGEENSCTCASG